MIARRQWHSDFFSIAFHIIVVAVEKLYVVQSFLTLLGKYIPQ